MDAQKLAMPELDGEIQSRKYTDEVGAWIGMAVIAAILTPLCFLAMTSQKCLFMLLPALFLPVGAMLCGFKAYHAYENSGVDKEAAEKWLRDNGYQQ